MKRVRMILIVLVLVLGLGGGASAALVAHYKFDGNANDSSGNNLNGTAYGGPSYVAGVFGQALSLDGINDYVDCGNSPLFNITSKITLAAWVKTNDSGNGEHNDYIVKGDHSYGLKHYLDGSIQLFTFDAGGWHSVETSVGAAFNGVWHHIAGTYDGSSFKLYIDGTLSKTVAYTGSIASSTYPVNIGRNAEIPSRLYNGLIDDVRIYNDVLTAAEIKDLATIPVDSGKAFTYQGRLLDGNVVADGLYDLQFSLYDAPIGGNQKGSTVAIEDMDVIEGYFTVDLDFGEGVFDGNPRWLQIAVRPGASTGSFTVLDPRQQIAPTPYALYAFSSAGGLQGPPGPKGDKGDPGPQGPPGPGGGTDTDWTISGSDIYRLSGNVGIGTTSPIFKLHVNGGTATAINGESAFLGVEGYSVTGIGVFGNTGSGTAVDSYSNDGTGVRGYSYSGTGIRAESTTGYAGWFEGPKSHFSGNVGIGTTAPSYKLDVAGPANLNNGKTGAALLINGTEAIRYDGSYFSWAFGGQANYFPGQVGIGTTSPKGKLDVNGKIFQRGLEIHADYVFEPDYKLESIDEHAEFMWKNRHLPAMPKAQKDENGQEMIEVGTQNKGIVEELEKAHIYIEQLHKRITTLEERLAKLESRPGAKEVQP